MIVTFNLEAYRLVDSTSGDSPKIACGGIAMFGGVSKLNELVYGQMLTGEISPELQVFHSGVGNPMERQAVGALVDLLLDIHQSGHKIVTWNGTGFDFRLLAHESGRFADCAKLAREHYDLMLAVVGMRGHWLAVEKALNGADISVALPSVQLRDGTVVDSVTKAHVPNLWQSGESMAVFKYTDDILTKVLLLAHHVLLSGKIGWIANSGRWNSVRLDRLLTVNECYGLPPVTTAWATSPKTVDSLAGWTKEFYR